MKTLYAEIIVDIALEKLDRPFTYRVPPEMSGQIAAGSVVEIPFGNGDRQVKGYVIGFRDHADYPEEKIKDIKELKTGAETAEDRLVALAAWMSRSYGSTFAQALRTVVPVKKAVRTLTSRKVSFADPGQADSLRQLYERRHYKAKLRVLAVLPADAEMEVQELSKAAEVPVSVIDGMIRDGVLRLEEADFYRDVIEAYEKEAAREDGESRSGACDALTDEQEEVLCAIRKEWTERKRPVLLRGVTGSGKTVVYTELIADTLAAGKQVIVLIPEIALTRQTVTRFVRRFGRKVSFLHSRLSQGERYDQMRAARAGDVSVMVGPRSALFTPFSKLGLIIIDEEHEDSYHSETVPRYHAREAAIERGILEDARILLGSATPSVDSSWQAEQGNYLELVMNARYGSARLPETEIVDMRQELESGNRSIFSRILRQRIGECLERHEQVMLFLNRRGYTGAMTCRSCGKSIKCPHCDVSLTRHRNGHLICHYCGYEIPEMETCPSCGSPHISGMTIGTEQVEELAAKEFPGASVLRMDFDTTRGKTGHSRILRDFGEGKADILVGTQMIVKGHDFPNVTLVGVLLADLSLNEDNYRSAEHSYQLVTQAVGRAGRGDKPGRAVIQTYSPEHFAVTAAAAQDYPSFYDEEILFRKMMQYPPTGSLMAILGECEEEELLSTGMGYLKQFLERIDPKNRLHTIGPAPQSIGRIRDQYRQVIYIRHRDREQLIRARQKLEEYISLNRGFDRIHIQYDVRG